MNSFNGSKFGVQPVIVLGAGGHASVVIDSLRRLGQEILGVTEISHSNGTRFSGLDVLGGDETIFSHSADEVVLVNGIGMVSGSNNRRVCAEKMRRAGYRFSTVIDPTAIISEEVELAEGVQVMAGAVLQPEVSLGTDTIINTGALIDHHCVIQDNCHICPGVTLAGGVAVEQGVLVGAGTTVVPGVVVGKEAIIGAGSVITKDVPPRSRVIQRRTP